MTLSLNRSRAGSAILSLDRRGASYRRWMVVWCPGFFFQAEDGIRDVAVTGVQTCALPICSAPKAVNYAVELTLQPTYFEAPWGGYRQSGFGRELGPWSIEEYLQTKQVHINLSQQPIGWY